MQTATPLRFLLLQVITPHYHREDALRNMHELEQLVDTFGGEVVVKSIQHRVKPHPDAYIGQGKVEWLKNEVKTHKIDVVVLNAIVKPGQVFRLEKALWEVNTKIAVWDRVHLILNIFDKHATTTEAKLQIELAKLQQIGPRIYGLGRTELSRQGGGIGTRGMGETNIEFERRLMKKQIQQIRKKLDTLANQKKQRIHHRFEQGLGPVALVGYTSAGKTTLFNVLTGKQKQTHKGLFTTLDTVVGKMKLAESNVPILISDTIGFIEQLPPVLIDAFKSTLLESMEALLLLHVIDVSDERMERKMGIVNQILDDLNASQPRILVFNKVDQLKNGKVEEVKQQFSDQQVICISAQTGEGIPELKQLIHQTLIAQLEESRPKWLMAAAEVKT